MDQLNHGSLSLPQRCSLSLYPFKEVPDPGACPRLKFPSAPSPELLFLWEQRNQGTGEGAFSKHDMGAAPLDPPVELGRCEKEL